MRPKYDAIAQVNRYTFCFTPPEYRALKEMIEHGETEFLRGRLDMPPGLGIGAIKKVLKKVNNAKPI